MTAATVSTLDWVSTFVALAALVALIVNLALLRGQNKTIASTLDVTAQAEIQTSFFQVSEIFIQHPELRPHFYEDEQAAAQLSRDDQLRAFVVAEMLLDVFDAVTDAKKRLPKEDPVIVWDRYIEDALRNSQFLRDYAIRRRDWYDTRFVELVERIDRAQKA